MGDSFAHVRTVDVQDGLFAIRPDYGDQSSQRSVQLWANYFRMGFRDTKLVLYIYEMTFKAFGPRNSPTPDKELTVPEGKKLIQIIRCALRTSTFEKVRSDIATDFNKRLISCKRLGSNEMQTGQFTFCAENEPRPRSNAIRFQMILQEQDKLCVSDLLDSLASNVQGRGAHENTLPIIQALDIILAHRAKLSLENATPKQGKCFPLEPPDTETFALTGGYLRGVRGFFASVRATTDRPLVNCNACCGAFYNVDSLPNLFAMFLNENPSVEDFKRLESVIQGLRVELTHIKDENNRPIKSLRTIFGLARGYRGPRRATFYHEEDGRTYTVEEWWTKNKYGSFGDEVYPVVNVGNKAHPTLVPANVCVIYRGQMAKRRLEPTQNNDMITFARRDPEDIRESINTHAFRVLEFLNNSTLISFGISVNPGMLPVQGRVLQRPEIDYRAESEIPKVDERARWNMKGKTVLKSGQLDHWAILRIVRGSKDLQKDEDYFPEASNEFLKILGNTLGKKKVSPPTKIWRGPLKVDRDNEVALEEAFLQCQKAKIRLLVIVLPDEDRNTYNQIKKLGDVEYGISTVCVLSLHTKFYKMPASKASQYHANVGLKINLKLGGINHTLRHHNSIYKTTMVIGIDVTHPSPGPTKRTAPSVAAMVASVDDELGQWLADLRINTACKEMVDLVGPMLRTRLELWRSRHGNTLPDNLLIYRDGVSESQYPAVLQEEVGALRDTCKVMYKDRQPKITLIIVGKRHHTRFFRRLNDRAENPLFGTIVDKGVTEARNWDFFLQLHHALLGTARPAHYFVLLNEIFTRQDLGPNTNISDYLHKLTYDMCYLFGRSTGPVSIPPPVFYADLACERSRRYGDFDDAISDTSSMTGDDRGNPPGGRGEAQLPYRDRGSASQVADKPGPSNQRSSNQGAPGSSRNTPSKQGFSSTASGKKEDISKKQQRSAEGKLPDLMAGLTKKERNRLFEERTAAARAGSSSTAEGKKAEAKSATKAEGKGKGIAKKEGKLPEKQQPEPKPEEKKMAKEDSLSNAQGKKPELKVDAQEAEARTEEKKLKEKDVVVIHPNLVDTMFYV